MCVSDFRSEPRTFNHLLCIRADVEQVEGEKAESTWDFHFAALRPGIRASSVEKCFARNEKTSCFRSSLVKIHSDSNLAILAEHFLKAFNF